MRKKYVIYILDNFETYEHQKRKFIQIKEHKNLSM